MNALAPIEPDWSAYLTRPKGSAGPQIELLVTGARCAGCMAKIEGAVGALPGVVGARLNLTSGKLTVAFAPGRPAPGAVITALEGLGYPTTPFSVDEAAAAGSREGRSLTLALGVAAFGAGNAMMFSVPLWAGLFGQELGPSTRLFMQICSGAVAVPCALYAGRPFFGSAWRSLRAGRANMDVPISIGVVLTLALSVVETVAHGRDTYFDAAVSLLFLLLIGRWLDHRLRAHARSAAADILALQAPQVAILDPDGAERRAPVADVRAGDTLRIRPGERLAVDARVVSGRSDLDVAFLTGEVRLEPVGPGDRCAAGAVNQGGLLTVCAEARAEDSTLAALARLVEAGAQTRSRYVRLADKAAAIYVPVVHTAALATFLIGAILVGPHAAVVRAVAVLIITCPCALGLAAPAVQITASARLFRQKVLLKSGAALERLSEVDLVVFDKTGVLTRGRPTLMEAPAAVIAAAAALARGSAHPLSRALAEADGGRLVAEGVEETPGQGVTGRVDGRLARLGRADFVGAEGQTGEMELWFAIDGEAPVRFQFQDDLRPDALATVTALRRLGVEVRLLSGDRPGPVNAVADTLGIADRRAACTPQDKAAAIAAWTAEGRRVLMVGDGLNDTAALAKAHCSMAPGTALDASQKAADLIFLGDDLAPVAIAVEVARAAQRRTLENFAMSAAYNLIAAPAAMLGLVNPFLAALAMSGSSIVVTLNALRMAGAGRRP